MISIKNLHKSYTDSSAKQTVFENASYEFNSHGVYSVVGSSGSGKTTLLNLISGLDVFDKGSIEIKLTWPNGEELVWVGNAGDSLDIPRFTWHKAINIGVEKATIIEVWLGEELTEDDIERSD